jgi:type I restriction enzyme S subunit
MLTYSIPSEQVNDRFDAKYYDPYFVEIWQEALRRGFQVFTLGQISSKLKKGIFSIRAYEYQKQGVPFLRVSDIRSLSIDQKELAYISPERNRQDQKTSLTPGNLIIAKTGSKAVGITSFIPKWIPQCNISQDIIGVWLRKKVDPDFSVDANFVALFLASKLGRMQFDRVKTQQNQPHLTLDNVRKIKILFPPPSQQAELSLKVNQASEQTGHAIKLIKQAVNVMQDELAVELDAIPQSKFYSVASSEIHDTITPKFYYPHYKKALEAVRCKFPMVRLSQIAEMQRGDEIGSTNYRTFVKKRADDIPFIRTSDLTNYEIDSTPTYYVDPSAVNTAQDLRSSDVLVTKDGKIGFTALVTEEDNCITASGVARLRIKDDAGLDPSYIFAVLSTWVGLFQLKQRVVVASTIPHVSQSALAEIEIPVLSKKAQKDICILVDDARELIASKKKLLHRAEIEFQKLYAF